ncbi:MAG: hypothetical protein IJ677_07515 [Alphaproteobacteria bacterium]|nr:hypothetical protein [Alphaproteobacteria bacterium]
MLRGLLITLFGLAITFLVACEDKNSVAYLSKSEIYFFYQTTCPHCHTAAQYIKEKHPNLKIKGLDIQMPGNMKLFRQAVKDYNISSAAGTPLIGMGDKYIMGWGDDKEKVFEDYVEEYEK